MVVNYNRRWWKNNRSGRGFTLLEVILAVTIAVGMMVVVFYFYQQTAMVRKTALEEMERITAYRLVMDRLTTDLRTAINGNDIVPGLTGDATSLEFIHLDAPVRESLLNQGTGVTINIKKPKMRSTLKRTTYKLTTSGSTDGLYSLERIEKSFKYTGAAKNSTEKTKSESTSTNETSDLDGVSFLDDETESGSETTASNANSTTNTTSSTTGTNSTKSSVSSSSTNSLSNTNIALQESGNYSAMEGFIDDGTNQAVKINVGNVLVHGIGYFALRYYDGSSWINSWSKKELPLGIEITVGAEDPRTEDEISEEESEQEEEEFQSDVVNSQGQGVDGGSTGDDGGLSALQSALSSAKDDEKKEGFTAIEGDTSESETNVVVFRRVIFLPNAKTKSRGNSLLSTLNSTNSTDSLFEEIFQ